MLRINPLSSGKAAASYFSQSDYYETEAFKGRWFGKAAALLGLHGDVDRQDFERVINNRYPMAHAEANQPITPRMRADRRPGWDFTFNVPKSISVLWALTKDDRILTAMQQAVNQTLADIEEDVVTRVHHGRRMTTEKTGNMAFATFIHTTARPVGGYPDCSLHCHAVAANLTHDGKQFKAADIHLIKRDGPYFEARFHNRLAERLQHLGYAIERRGKGYEIASVSRNIIERFSARTQQIEEVARAKGITNAKQKAALGAKTREKKTVGIKPDALHIAWAMKLSDEERAHVLIGAKQASPRTTGAIGAQQAVNHAIAHGFDRESVVRQRRLATDALRYGIGRTTVGEIDRELAEKPLIRRGKAEEQLVTTDDVLKEEQALLRIARAGKGVMLPVNAEHQIKREFLSDEQRAAVTQLLSSNDRVQTLMGKAGVGKSTVAAEFADGVRGGGREILMLAPTSKAVDVLSRDGFHAHTLARFFRDKELQQSAGRQAIFLDEAGLVSTPDLKQLLELVQRLDARVILSGDARQHGSIGRGAAFDMLEREAGIQPVAISNIRRQKGEYKAAVEHFSQGNVKEGLAALKKLGWIHQLDGETRNKEIARRYVDSLEAGETALVVAPTHKERAAVAKAIHDEQRQRGRLTGDDHVIATLRSRGWTKAEKQDGYNYQAGDVIEFHARGKGGYRPGDRVVVDEVKQGHVWVHGPKGQRELPLASAGAFDVFMQTPQRFAVGEQIRVTRNRRGGDGEKRLTNGSVFKITGFGRDGEIQIGRYGSINATFGHVDNAVVTSFASQGSTVDRAFVAQSALSFPATSPEQAYVSASRARKSVEIFSDDVAGLMRAAMKMQPEQTASELVREAAKEKKRNDRQRRAQRHVERMRQWGQLIRGYADQGRKRISSLVGQITRGGIPAARRS